MQGRIEALVANLRSLEPADDHVANALRIEADYFERNADRLRYAE